MEKNRLVDSIRRKQTMHHNIFLSPFFPFLLAFYLAFALPLLCFLLLRFLLPLLRLVSVGKRFRTVFSPQTLVIPSVLQRLAEQREHRVSMQIYYRGNSPTW